MGRGPFDEPPLRTPPPVRRTVGPLPSRAPAALHDAGDGFDLLGEPAEETVDDPTTLREVSEWTEEMIELDADLVEPSAAVVVDDDPDDVALFDAIVPDDDADAPSTEGGAVFAAEDRPGTPRRELPEPEVMPDDIGVGLLPPDPEPSARPSLVVGRKPVVPVHAPMRAPAPPPPPPEEVDDDVLDAEDTPVDAAAPLRGSCPIVCQLALAIAAESIPCEAAAVLLGQADVLVFVAATGPVGPQLLGRCIPQGLGIAGHTFQSGRPSRSAEARQVPWHWDGLDRETDFQTRSVLSVPIVHAGRVRGVLQLLNRTGNSAFDQDDSDVLASVADVLGEDLKWASVHAELAPVVASRRG